MDPDKFAGPLADNVKQLRETQNLTQAQLAKKAGIPRATLSLLESGTANPTLAVVLRVGNALDVRLEELLEPARSDTVVFRAHELPLKRRGKTIVRQLLPQSLAGVALEDLEIPAGQTLVGVPHTIGTREYLVVQAGVLLLHLSGETFELEGGDVIVFRGHQPHSYQNLQRKTVRAISVIAQPSAQLTRTERNSQ